MRFANVKSEAAIVNKQSLSRSAWYARLPMFVAGAVLFVGIAGPAGAQTNPGSASAAGSSGAGVSSPVVKAMLAELDRSKNQLQMENIARPYYIEYRVTDIDEYDADAAFGAVRQEQHAHIRMVRATVRIGDYKQDSYFGRGGGGIVMAMPLGDDVLALRHALWLATDSAYKEAGESLAQKQAMLKQFTTTDPVDDFARATPMQASLSLVHLNADTAKTDHMLAAATALYREDPEIQSLGATARFSAVNDYYVNSEGTVTSSGQSLYLISLLGTTQAADGMRLDRSPYTLVPTSAELPTEEKLVSDTRQMIATLKLLRDAPVVEEEYRGPVLISPDAADDVVASLIGDNVLGRKPGPGRGGRTVGSFTSNYKSRVLPPFVSVTDDPTLREFDHLGLIGAYSFDDEGVKVAPIDLVEKGQLVNFLTSRQPILDFPASNGHGRASAGGPAQPYYGVLELKGTEASSAQELKQKLIQMCKDQGKEYGYRVETLGGLTSPRLLYRVWVKDGHEELVRGAVLNELDVRGLRGDLVAVGNDPLASNRIGGIPASVISPSLLFDELELRRDDRAKAKLPEYPAPPISSPVRTAAQR